ncbi:MAG: hypothetical protein RLZ37_1312, partial [Actinomycetota bacterium]
DLLRTGALGVSSLALGPFLAACGGSSTTSSGSGASGGQASATLAPDTNLVQRWVSDQLTPGFVRLPISIADQSGMLPDGPEVLTGRIIRYLDNAVVAENLSAERLSLGEGTPAFWVFTANIDAQDVYALVVDGGPEDGASLQIRDPEFMTVPRVGQVLPPLDTPTVDDARGVEIICTRVPEPCPFHDVTLGQALAEASSNGSKVVFLVGTPAHCQTAVCAPILDNLIALQSQFPDVRFVHVDVYADEAATKVAPAVQALTLTFEPVLWITDSTGVITHRFEGVWHPSEVAQALSS